MRVILESIFFVILLSSGCIWNNGVEKKWKNYAPIEKESYRRDSIQIMKLLWDELKIHRGFFESKIYTASTQIIIDTIIYSPNFQKIAVFILSKNPTYDPISFKVNPEWAYNATCYLGKRKNDSLVLYSSGPTFTNSTDKKELIKISRAGYFTIFSKFRDGNGEYRYKYNLGDVRFWSCPIWKEEEENRQRRIGFEKYSKEHPENVYPKVNKH